MSSKDKKRTAPSAWVQQVMAKSDAMDLEQGVFLQKDPRGVARSLKHAAEQSQRRKSSPFRSAMSMLNFHINRSGRRMAAGQRRVLERAKAHLRALFGRSR